MVIFVNPKIESGVRTVWRTFLSMVYLNSSCHCPSVRPCGLGALGA